MKAAALPPILKKYPRLRMRLLAELRGTADKLDLPLGEACEFGEDLRRLFWRTDCFDRRILVELLSSAKKFSSRRWWWRARRGAGVGRYLRYFSQRGEQLMYHKSDFERAFWTVVIWNCYEQKNQV